MSKALTAKRAFVLINDVLRWRKRPPSEAPVPVDKREKQQTTQGQSFVACSLYILAGIYPDFFLLPGEHGLFTLCVVH